MKIINTKIHGALDYVVGGLLVASPWLFGFYKGGNESYVPIVLGAMTILYSLCTDYELGIFKLLSVRTHLMMDVVSAFILGVSPWLFDFDEVVYLPHVAVAAMEFVVVLLSDREAYYANPSLKV